MSLPRHACLLLTSLSVVLLSCGNDEAPGLVDSRCAPSGEAPQSIDEAIDRINGLPDPSLSCLVASLPRPLRITATNSPFSAQPAEGFDRPRVFLHSDGLVLSVTLGEAGAHLLEFGEWTDDEHTIKGEIAFPIDEGGVSYEEPYLDLERSSGSGTSCGICHGNEQAVEDRLSAFESLALQPRRNQVVNVDYLRAITETCDPEADLHQCTMLHTIFDYGDVVHEDFRETIGTL